MLTLYSAVYTITQSVRDRLRSEKGLEAIEYALIAALLSAIIVGIMATMNTSITAIFNAIAARLNTAAGTVGGGG